MSGDTDATNSDTDMPSTPRPLTDTVDAGESAALLALALEDTTGGPWRRDPDGTCHFSRRCLDLYGLPVAVAGHGMQTWLSASVAPADRNRVGRVLNEFLAGGRTGFDIEFRIRHPHRGLRRISSRAVRHVPVKGPPALLGLDVDITNARRERTLARMAADMAHDFNNLLAIVSGKLELAAPAIADGAARARIRAALEAIRTGTAITRRIPAAAGETTEPGPPPSAMPADESAADPQGIRHGDGELILVAGADETGREAMLRRLEVLGYAAIGAGSEHEAFAAIEGGEPVDLVLVDMAPAEARVLARRTAAHAPLTRFLLVSDSETAEPATGAEQTLAVLRTPCSLPALAAALRQALARD